MAKLALLGGSPIRTQPFPSRKTMGEQEKQAAMRVLDSDVLSAFIGGPGPLFNGGPEVLGFENEWARREGFRHAISFNSWTSGLMAAAGAIGIEPGDEVITTPYTMSATATSLLFYGGIPVFADIDPDTFCLDPAAIEACITPRTRAILVVHLFGRPAEMEAIVAIARRHNLRVIEDAAQAPGARYKGQPVGAIGDLGGFSLNFHKHIHTGEGGILVTQSDDLAWRARLIRNHGENALDGYEPEQLVNVIGGNFRLTELQAAIGREQLKRLDGYLHTRQDLAAYLTDRLSRLPGIRTSAPLPADTTHSWYVFPFRYQEEETGVPRSLFVKAVQAELPPAHHFEQVPLVEGYVRPLYLNPIYQLQRGLGKNGFPFNCNTNIRYDYPPGLCPVTERLYAKEMVLSPLVREPMSLSDMQDLADAIEKVLTQGKDLYERVRAADSSAILTPLEATNRTQGT